MNTAITLILICFFSIAAIICCIINGDDSVKPYGSLLLVLVIFLSIFGGGSVPCFEAPYRVLPAYEINDTLVTVTYNEKTLQTDIESLNLVREGKADFVIVKYRNMFNVIISDNGELQIRERNQNVRQN